MDYDKTDISGPQSRTRPCSDVQKQWMDVIAAPWMKNRSDAYWISDVAQGAFRHLWQIAFPPV
jgi:hypothetical protein